MVLSKKGESLSMNVIIIAILALLVLVVLSLMFIGRMNSTREGVESICRVEFATAGATCETSASACTDKQKYVADGKFTDCPAPSVCCVNTEPTT